MYKLKKTIEISCAHSLKGHKRCGQIHGHNYIITVHCLGHELKNGMLCDLNLDHIKELDHKNLNDFLETPTMENLARYIFEKTDNAEKIEIQETGSNYCSYEDL